MTKVLTSHAANINRKDPTNGETILHHHIKNDSKWAAEFLIDSGARVDLVDNQNESVLHYLAKKKKIGKIRGKNEYKNKSKYHKKILKIFSP